jgi:two-component system, sensor histidine kinase and response regulator
MEKSTLYSILVVDDNPAMNTAICDILDLNHYRVFSAQNGQQALKLLQQERPDAIICDIIMPQLDGFGLLRHTRADKRLRTIPFIFLTARFSAEDKRKAKSIGIEDYLVKPVDPEDLILAIENVLRRSQNLAIERKAQIDHLRSQIVRTLQHEFRTPLTFILGYAEYLAELNGEKVDLDTLQLSTNAILEGGHRLQDLVEKFLLLADVQFREELPEDGTRIRVHRIFQDAFDAMNREATKFSMQIVLPILEDNAEVVGDMTYLHKAIVELIENAIRYGRPDSRHIWLLLRETEDYVGLMVKDEGCGISSEILDKIRQPFEQANRDERTMPGAGLSLALVQHVARLHGGFLEVETEEGKGSSFTLWVPRPHADKNQVETR